MSLERRLDAIRAGFEAQADAATLAVMHGATDALTRSGQADRAKGVGDAAPAFTLPALDGAERSLAELKAEGPLVLTWFRGHW